MQVGVKLSKISLNKGIESHFLRQQRISLLKCLLKKNYYQVREMNIPQTN